MTTNQPPTSSPSDGEGRAPVVNCRYCKHEGLTVRMFVTEGGHYCPSCEYEFSAPGRVA
jgi:hypothetical protein